MSVKIGANNQNCRTYSLFNVESKANVIFAGNVVPVLGLAFG